SEISATSDELGRFELAGLNFETEYRLQGKADGFAPAASEPFLIPRNQQQSGVDIYLSLGATVTGEIILEDGSPVANQRVWLFPSGETMMQGGLFGPVDAESDETGQFAMRFVPAGAYQLD